MISVTEIIEGLRTIRIADADGLHTEVYLLECEGGLILIDVGETPLCRSNIEAELMEMGRSWKDIEMIIITHAHGDHIGNLPQVKALTGAEVIIGLGDERRLKERTGVKADLVLGHEDLIGACGGIEIVHVPGHSDGNLCLYLHKSKVIIAGDTIFSDEKVPRHLYIPEKYASNHKKAVKNLNILLDYDFEILLMTHGLNVMENAKQAVSELIANPNYYPIQ